MKKLLEQYNAKPIKRGQILEGKIIKVGKAKIFVDLGSKGTGVIYGREFYKAKQQLKDVEIGDPIPVKVISPDSKQGYVELSLKAASEELTWGRLKEKKEKGQSFKVKIVGANKGGLLTKISNLEAFIPASQLAPEHYPRVEGGDKSEILKELQKLVGEELKVKVLSLDPEQDKLILSEKATKKNNIKQELKNYEPGDLVEGEVTGIVDFGAFMKFEGEQYDLEGLIHISELDWKLIQDPSQVVEIGEKIKAKIINIEGDRVSLSLKELKPNPWEKVEQKFQKGDLVQGKVTKIDSFGAFVELSPKIQGLCHVSRFDSRKKMSSALEVGQEYTFKILMVDPQQHKIILDFKQNEQKQT